MRITETTSAAAIREYVGTVCETLDDVNKRLRAAMDAEGLKPTRTGRVCDVNRVLKAAGYVERITAGRGYYYWRDGASFAWSSVYVYRAAHLSLAEWMYEAAVNIAAHGAAAR